MTSHWNVSFAQLADPSVSWGDLFADWIAEMDGRRQRTGPLPRAGFQEPLPVRVAPRPALSIRVPPLKVWTCDSCHNVYPNDVYQCDDCAEDEEDEEEDCSGSNPWYCRVCDDFCSNGRGICRRCEAYTP